MKQLTIFLVLGMLFAFSATAQQQSIEVHPDGLKFSNGEQCANTGE